MDEENEDKEQTEGKSEVEKVIPWKKNFKKMSEKKIAKKSNKKQPKNRWGLLTILINVEQL